MGNNRNKRLYRKGERIELNIIDLAFLLHHVCMYDIRLWKNRPLEHLLAEESEVQIFLLKTKICSQVLDRLMFQILEERFMV